MLHDDEDLSDYENIISSHLGTVQFIGELPFSDTDRDLLCRSVCGTITRHRDLASVCETYPVSIACFLIAQAIESPDIETFWELVFSGLGIAKTPENQELCMHTFLCVLSRSDTLFSSEDSSGEDFFYLLGLHCLIEKDACHDLENLVSELSRGIQSKETNAIQELLEPEETHKRKEEATRLDEMLHHSSSTQDFELFLKKLAVIALFHKEKDISQTAYTLLHKIYSSISDDEITVSPEIEQGLSVIFERGSPENALTRIAQAESPGIERILQEQNKIPILLTDILRDQKESLLDQYKEVIYAIKSELISEIQNHLKETLFSINEARIKTQYQIEKNKTKFVDDISQCINSARTLEDTVTAIQSAIEQNTEEIRSYVSSMRSEIHSDLIAQQGESDSIRDSLDRFVSSINPSITEILTEIRRNNADTLDLLQIVEDKTKSTIEESEQTIIADLGDQLQALDALVQSSRTDIVTEMRQENTAASDLLQNIQARNERNMEVMNEISQAMITGIADQKDAAESLHSVLLEVGNDVLRTKEDMLLVLQDLGEITKARIDESEFLISSEIQEHIDTLRSSFSSSHSQLLSEFQQSKGDTRDLLHKIESRTLSRITESEIATTNRIESRVSALADSLETAKFYLGSKVLENKEDMLSVLREIEEVQKNHREKDRDRVIDEVKTQVSSLNDSILAAESDLRTGFAAEKEVLKSGIGEIQAGTQSLMADVEARIVEEIRLQNSLLHEFKDSSLNTIGDVQEKVIDSALVIEEMKDIQRRFTSDVSYKIDGLVSQLQDIAQKREGGENIEVSRLRQKARILLSEGSPDDLFPVYHEIIAQNPGDTDAWTSLAYLSIKNGAYDEGIRIIRTELADGYSSDLLDFWYAYARYKSGITDTMPYETESRFTEARRMYQAARYDEARILLESIEASHRNDPRYAIYRAFCLLKTGDLVAARYWVSRCHELDPADRKVSELLVTLGAKINQPDPE